MNLESLVLKLTGSSPLDPVDPNRCLRLKPLVYLNGHLLWAQEQYLISAYRYISGRLTGAQWPELHTVYESMLPGQSLDRYFDRIRSYEIRDLRIALGIGVSKAVSPDTRNSFIMGVSLGLAPLADAIWAQLGRDDDVFFGDLIVKGTGDDAWS